MILVQTVITKVYIYSLNGSFDFAPKFEASERLLSPTTKTGRTRTLIGSIDVTTPKVNVVDS